MTAPWINSCTKNYTLISYFEAFLASQRRTWLPGVPRMIRCDRMSRRAFRLAGKLERRPGVGEKFSGRAGGLPVQRGSCRKKTHHPGEQRSRHGHMR